MRMRSPGGCCVETWCSCVGDDALKHIWVVYSETKEV